MKYTAVRLTREHVWKIARCSTLEAAQRALHAAIEEGAAHFMHHSGPGGFASIVPIEHGAFAVLMFDRTGSVELDYHYEVLSRADLLTGLLDSEIARTGEVHSGWKSATTSS